jgi:curved DNA-binding protein CbpA
LRNQPVPKEVKDNPMSLPDYYEFLQISPNAESDTIHRVHKFLAMRFHPDNPATGDSDKFHTLQEAYEVLSDQGRRNEYDLKRGVAGSTGTPISFTVDFMDSTAGEVNRRLAVLAVLYIRRRNMPDSPGVPLGEIEARMGFPREYLQFTLWYLQRKGYIARSDNGETTLLAEGVDFVETERHGFPILNRLLTSGDGVSNTGGQDKIHEARPHAVPVIVGMDRRKGDRRKRKQTA